MNDGLDNIDAAAFRGCESLEEIVFPETLSYIMDEAFEYCESLRKIDLSKCKNVILYESAFANCSSLDEILFNEKMTSISSGAFENCMKLSKIELPESLNIVKCLSFAGCTDLSRAFFPSSVKEIEFRAFENCTSLSDDVVLNDGLEQIGQHAFWNTDVSSIFIPKSVKNLESPFLKSNAESVRIYCEEESQPLGWQDNWNNGYEVIWGCNQGRHSRLIL